MEISIGTYKLRVEIVVAIVVVFWVMFGHLLCSCCKLSLFEGLTSQGNKIQKAQAEVTQKQSEFDTAQKNLDNAKGVLVKLLTKR